MILTDKDNTRIIIECDCGCKMFDLSKWEGEYILDFKTSIFSSKQETSWQKFKEKIKVIWTIIRRGTYFLHEVMLTQEDVNELIEAINKWDTVENETN